jgi:hypothetical protein
VISSIASFLASVPFFGVWVVALVLAVSRWNKHPTASALVVVGGCIQVVAALSRFVVPTVISALGISDRDGYTLAFSVIGVVSTGGLACVVAAVFADRPAA